MTIPAEHRQRMLDGAPCAFLATTLDGRVIWTNRTLADWIGDADLDLTGASIHDVLTAGGRIKFEMVTPSLVLNGEVRHVALDLRRLDGTTLGLICTASVEVPDDAASGEPEVWWVGLDAAERRDYERDLLVAQRRLRRLQDLSSALVSATSVDAVGEALLGALVDGVKADSGEVFLHDETDGLTRVAAVPADRTGRVPDGERCDGGPVQVALSTGRAVFVSEDAGHADASAGAAPSERRHQAVLPLVGDDRLVGVMRLTVARAQPHSPDEQHLLRSAAEIAAQALERVRLLDRHRRDAELNRAATALLHRLEEATTLAERAQLVADFLVPAHADFAIVDLPAVATEPLGLRHHDPSLEPTLRWLQASLTADAEQRDSPFADLGPRTPRRIDVIDESTYARFGLDADQLTAVRALQPTSYLGLSLVARGATIGSLALAQSAASGRRFSDADMDYYGRLADTCALALENARLYEHERGIAQQLQTALLPSRLPDDPRVHLASFYEAGVETGLVGGDWYDVFVLDDDRLGLMVGDVVGGGLGAATSMARLRVAAHAYALDGRGVVDVVDRLHRFAATVDGAFASTVVYAEIDLRDHVLEYTCAGHPPPVVHHPGETPQVVWGGRGPLLAVGAARSVPDRIALRPGSSVVFYTDGLVERRGRRLDDGIAELTEALGRRPDLATRPAELARSLGSGPSRDDTCILTAVIGEG